MQLPTLIVWGINYSPDDKTQEAMVHEFERRNGVTVKALSMGAGTMNPQKLMTAIVGKTPPDVIYQDRFTIGDWASRDTFTPLDHFLAEDKKRTDGVKQENFYPATWSEATYQGHTYAIPAGCDDRCLFWNKRIFKEHEKHLKDAGLDPTSPPKDWDELFAYAKALTEYNPDGSYKQIGFLPNFGNSWLYLYSWQNEGDFMSADGRICTINNPRTKESLEYMMKVYDALGGMTKLNKFTSGFSGNEQDPFITGKIAMKIDGDWVLNSIARYGPDTDFGVSTPPVPKERLVGTGVFKGKPKFITWAGGFSYAIPIGVTQPELSWKFIRWMTSPEGMRVGAQAQTELAKSKGRLYVPRQSANLRTNEMLFNEFAPKDPKYHAALRQFIDLMPCARFRPVTFVGQLLWDEHIRAFEQATYHTAPPEKSLADAQGRVQRELDKVYTRNKFPILNWSIPTGLLFIVITIFGFYITWHWKMKIKLGRLGRAETYAGYGFISPWILGFIVFTVGPVLASIIFSFCDYDVLHAARWVGLNNYHELITFDLPRLLKAFDNVRVLAMYGIPLNIVTGLSIAMLLNTGVKGMSAYRTAFYMPSIVPIVASAVLWQWVLQGDPNHGLLNAAWQLTITPLLHIAPPGWLSAPEWAKPALLVMGLWGAGGGMVLWLAGLQGVPKSLYEAASIDGASGWQSFKNITLPQISPYIFFNLVMGVIGALQEFDRVYVLGGSGAQIGPEDSLLMPVYYLFTNGFTYFKMGYASAMAWIIFVIVLTLTLIQWKIAPTWVHYDN